MEKLTTKCLGAFSITKVSSSGPAGSGAVDSVNGKTGSVIITKSDIGLSKVNNTSDLNKPISTATQQALNEIDSKILANKDDIDALQTDVADINHELSTFTTDADVDAKITEHNLHDQSHNDIRNSLVETNREVATKAGKVTVSDNKQEVGTVAVIHTDGSYIASDTKLTELKNSIDALNSDMGAFVSVSQDAALKSKDNTFTASNTFSGNVAFNGSKIHLTNNASVINGKNDKAILTTKGDDTNDQTTYIGGDKVEIYSPDSVSIETNQITIKRNGTNYTNIDSGNISEYAAGGSATPVIEKYGIKGDYQTHYGIINCQNGLIKYSYNNRRITVPAGLQLLLPNNNDIITTVSGDIVYDITSNDHFTLFYASEYDELLLEAGDVFYQVEEPDNGASNFIAWYNPEIDAWKFKSATAGNVWSEATRATPLADIRLSGDNITRIDYVGYRVFNNQIFAIKDYLIAGDNITITTDTNNPEKSIISATGGTGATPETVTGDKVQVSYTRNDVAEETNLNAFCDGVVHDVDNLASIVPTECEQVVTTNTNQTITGNKTFSTAIVANGGVRMAAGQALSAGSDTLVQMVQNYSANGTDTDSVIVGAQGSTDRLILQANAGVLHKRGSAFFEVIDSGNIADNIPSNVVKSNEITTIKRLTQAEYDALTTKDENTFYVVTGA